MMRSSALQRILSHLARQELLERVDRELGTINECTRDLVRDLPAGDPRRREGEKILEELAALNRCIVEGLPRTGASVW